MLWRNYGLRVKAATKKPRTTLEDIPEAILRPTPPATAMGLTTPKESILDMVRYAWEFRLGIEHAKRMSRWVPKRKKKEKAGKEEKEEIEEGTL